MISLVVVYFNMENLGVSSTNLYHDPVRDPKLTPYWNNTTNQDKNDSNGDKITFKGVESNIIKHDWMTQMEERYLKVVENIEKVCAKYGLNNTNKILINQLMVDEDHHLAYCQNAKVGSTTWMHHFNMLLPSNRRPWDDKDKRLSNPIRTRLLNKFKVGHKWKKYKWGESINRSTYEEFAKDSNLTTFTFVRHPFERLVSAYIDKLEKHQHISAKYDKIMERKSFPEFVEIVLQEFETSKINPHWKPYFNRCFHCAIPYNVIGRIETFQEDVQYIILKNNLEKILDLKTTLQFSSKNSSKRDAQKAALKYFSKLNANQIQRLYKAYKMDFELFDYDIDIYLRN